MATLAVPDQVYGQEQVIFWEGKRSDEGANLGKGIYFGTLNSKEGNVLSSMKIILN